MSAVDWKTFKLDQLGTVGRGKSRHRPRNDAILYGGRYPFFQTGDIKAANFYLTEYSQTYSEAGLAQSKLWKPGTLCITIAANIAESAILGVEGCFPDSVVGFIADPNKADVRFVKYYLEILKLRMQNVSHGSTQDNLSLDKLLSFDFLVPSLSTQRRIAGILSAYDDLIENSQRRIKILESMARALYREWFVQLRFPGHESVPLAPSPLGEIPQGWEVKKLGDICARMESGGTPKRSTLEYWEGGEINWYKTGELWDGFLFEAQEKITARGQRESTARLFEPGTILMAIYGSPTVGRMGILTTHASCNQAALGLVADKRIISQIYLYFVLYSLRDHFNGLAQGAAQQNISKEKVSGAMAVIPTRQVLHSFDNQTVPVFEQIRTLQQQIQNLRRTRDLLLPRLLSGQFDLGEVEDALEIEPRAAEASEPPVQAVQARPKAEALAPKADHEASPSPKLDEILREDVLITIRRLFSEGGHWDRDDAIREVANMLGFTRLGARIQDMISTEFMTAVRRGIVVKDAGSYRLGFRSYADCTRDSLKNDFESAMGRGWTSRDDAIRAFARWSGFARVGEVIDETARSLINGLIREGRIEADGPELIRRSKPE